MFFSGKPLIWIKAVIFRKPRVNLSDQVVLAWVIHILAWHHSSLIHWGPWSGLSQRESMWRKVFGPAPSVQICAVVIILSLFLQLECVLFALLTRSDWSLQGNSWWIKITQKIITIIPHLLIWLLFLPLATPWKINTLILFYMSLCVVRKWLVFLLFLSFTQWRRAAGGWWCLYTVIKFHCVVFLTSGTNITHLFWPKELPFSILHNTSQFIHPSASLILYFGSKYSIVSFYSSMGLILCSGSVRVLMWVKCRGYCLIRQWVDELVMRYKHADMSSITIQNTTENRTQNRCIEDRSIFQRNMNK